MMKIAQELTVGDQLTGELSGTVIDKFITMDKDRNRCVALVLEDNTPSFPFEVLLPLTALVAVKAQA